MPQSAFLLIGLSFRKIVHARILNERRSAAHVEGDSCAAPRPTGAYGERNLYA